MVWPTRLRRRQRKHAFEQALDDVRLDPDGEPVSFEELTAGRSGAARSVASFGDITVAPGYVAQGALKRAYDDGADQGPPSPAVRPAEAVRTLKAELEKKGLTSKDLARLRRQFAADHHPDRVPLDLREEALHAMAEVNAAIDLALKRAARS
ncbi:hypothetical protein W911_03915 [Hyphomicrobium nitrativorans NL23]|uniref:Uncharacterized protein n=1 Tax=Hyphomicrobium nitrativorans NL23 TaxID=1029756 RepID=V5SAQ6_9HYPH|nr:hypothetical protein [Hyphomicrobium nitrativorans]AHB47743.1 hypothetical protein W911_03915 [Hyphomicrobium nitrativorans NL23]